MRHLGPGDDCVEGPGGREELGVEGLVVKAANSVVDTVWYGMVWKIKNGCGCGWS